MTVQIPNKIIILTAPSGAGKTSITRFLLQKYSQLAFSVSAATRSARDNEKNGVDYYFMSVDEFNQKIRNNEFVEWEMVYDGKYYGTLKSEFNRIWENGQIPILDIDVKGAIHVQQQYLENSFSMFIEPPSVDELKRRLESRGTENSETLQARLNKAAYEISFKHHFHKIIVNSNLNHACQEAEDAIKKFLQG
ncbi:MAG: guanylate kinase [Chitinophagaceae bacterium]